MKDAEKFKKIQGKLSFNYTKADNINYPLFLNIFDDSFIKSNYKNCQENINDKNFNNFIINPTAEQLVKKNRVDGVFLFTFDYIIRNGLLIELNKNFFRNKLHKFQKILDKYITQVNSNINNLDKKTEEFGTEFIKDLPLLYVKIDDIKSFILNMELYGETKDFSQDDLKNLLENSVSNVSRDTSEIVGQFFEDSVLIYFLQHLNIKPKSILPRLIFYMDFILFRCQKNKIYLEFVPFNQLKKEKTESYNEIDFCFYTTEDIQIPKSVFDNKIFVNTLKYAHNKETEIKEKEGLIFPQETLTFFELKNNIDKDTNNNNYINLDSLINQLETFMTKLPIYIELYKTKKLINNDCKKIELVFFYNHNFCKLEDSVKAKNSIKEIIEKRFLDMNININIEIIFASKQIQTINYCELMIENINFKKRIIQLEIEVEQMKKAINNKQDIQKEIFKKDEGLALDELNDRINDKVEEYKRKFTGIKSDIFSKIVEKEKFKEYVHNDENNIIAIDNLANYLKNEIINEELNSKGKNKLVKKILKKLLENKIDMNEN